MTDRITLADTRDAGLCIKGMREFMERSGVDFKDFARHGIEVERARQIDGWQALVDHVLAVKGAKRG